MSQFEDEIKPSFLHQILIDHYKLMKRAKYVTGGAVFAGIFITVLFFFNIDLLSQSVDTEGMSDDEKRTFALFFLSLALIGGTGFWLVVSNGPLTGWFLFKSKKKLKEILFLQSVLIRKSYMMNFELVPPQGENQLDRLFNHLTRVFPQISEIRKKRLKKGLNSINYSRKHKFLKKLSILRNYDLVIYTSTGLFIVKKYDKKVTMNEIRNTINALNLHQIGFKLFGPEDITRVIFLGSEFDSYFYTGEFKSEMANVERRFACDLIEEDEYGYAMIWMD